MFKYIDSVSFKGIPKEMYISELIKFKGFIIYSFVVAMLLFFDEKICAALGILYFAFSYGVYLICIFMMIRKSFLTRYKILNIHNFKFLLLGIDGPYPKKIGRCQIVQEYKKKGKNMQ